MYFRICLLLFLATVACGCKTWHKLMAENPALVEKIDFFEPIPKAIPVIVLFAEEKLPENSVIVTSIKFGETSRLLNNVYMLSEDFEDMIRKQGANIIQVFETKYTFNTPDNVEFILYRNLDISNYELMKSRNASTLPKDANYAKIYFYNDYEYYRDCILTNTASETVGNISKKNKMEFKTTAFGLQTFKLVGFENSAIELDVQAGKEYYVRMGETGATQDYRGNLKLEILENYVGRHFYNKWVPRK